MSPEELFYGFPEPIPAVCWKLRDLVLDEAPEAVESVRPRWRVLGFDLGPPPPRSSASEDRFPLPARASPMSLDRYFCAVAPQRDHARLLFEHGVELDDPEGLLQGSGNQVRFLKYTAPSEVDEAVVRAFVRKAIAHLAR